jgi:putative redox protein
MAKISSSIIKELYKIEIKSPTGNSIIADEPLTNVERISVFSPKELVGAALAACTSATVRMYADQKKWSLDEVKIDVDLDRDDAENKTIISRKIQFIGALDKDQEKRLLSVANACPVHKILSSPVEIATSVI